MTTQERDYEEILRRALAAAAESIEPAGDGLQRIRHRLDSRRSPRSVFLACAGWLDVHGTRLLVRLEPALEAGRTALRRGGPLSAALLALGSLLRTVFSPRGRQRAGGHRGSGRLGPAGAWLKPVFAVSLAVAIVAVGVVILNHATGTLVSPAGISATPGPGSSAPGGAGKTANSGRWRVPLGVKTAPQVTGRAPNHKASVLPAVPAVACTPTPAPAVSTPAPAGSGSASPTPTVTGSPTATPTTPQPTDTGSPTPTPTTSSASGTASGTTTTTATAAALMVPYHAGTPLVVHCGAAPKATATP